MVFKRLTWRQLLTVEPVIFLYAYGMFMHQPVIQQYIYSRVSEMKNYTYDYRNPGINKANCVENQHNSTLEQQVFFKNVNLVNAWLEGGRRKRGFERGTVRNIPRYMLMCRSQVSLSRCFISHFSLSVYFADSTYTYRFF